MNEKFFKYSVNFEWAVTRPEYLIIDAEKAFRLLDKGHIEWFVNGFEKGNTGFAFNTDTVSITAEILK